MTSPVNLHRVGRAPEFALVDLSKAQQHGRDAQQSLDVARSLIQYQAGSIEAGDAQLHASLTNLERAARELSRALRDLEPAVRERHEEVLHRVERLL